MSFGNNFATDEEVDALINSQDIQQNNFATDEEVDALFSGDSVQQPQPDQEPAIQPDFFDQFKTGDIKGPFGLRGPQDISPQTVADIAFPTVGGVIGGAVGGPLAPVTIPVGAALGKGVQEGIEALLGQEKKFSPSSIKEFMLDDTVIGNVVKEGVFNAIGGAVVSKFGPKVVSAFQKSLNPKKFMTVKNEIIKDFRKEGDKAFSKLGEYLQGVIDDVPKEAKGRAIREIALQTEKNGFERPVTERVLTRGASKVLSKKNLATDTIDVETAKKASEAFNDSFKNVGDVFNKEIEPLVKNHKGKINTSDMISKYMDDIADLVKVEFSSTGRPIVKPLSGTERGTATQIKLFSEQIMNLFDDPSANNLHLFRRNIRRAIDAKSIQENPSAKKALMNMSKRASDLLEENVPGYKNINNKFRAIFELRDEIGTKVTSKRIESLARDYLNPKNSVFKSSVDDLIRFSKNTNIDDLIDQTAAKNFISIVKKDKKFFGIFGLGFNIPFTGKSAKQIGKRLLGHEKLGIKTPGQKALRSGLQTFTGQQIGAPLRAKEEGLQ